jgi:hypothetical protein
MNIKKTHLLDVLMENGNYLAPLPPKGEFHSKNAKILHFLMLFMFTEWNSPFGGRGAKFLIENVQI